MPDYRLLESYGALGVYSDTARTMGMEFSVSTSGWVTHIHALKPTAGAPAATVGAVWTTGGTYITGTAVNFPSVAAGYVGWITAELPTPIAIASGKYRVGALRPTSTSLPGQSAYWVSGSGSAGHVNGPLSAPSRANAVGTKQGMYTIGTSIAFPDTGSGSGANYGVDVTFTDTDPFTQALSGDGSTSSTTTGDATHTSAHVAYGLASSNTTGDGTADAGHTSYGVVASSSTVGGEGVGSHTDVGGSESYSDGLATHTGSHVADGSVESFTDGSGEGVQDAYGSVDSTTETSGEYTADHLDEGAVSSETTGSGEPAGQHESYGELASSTSPGNGTSIGHHTGSGLTYTSSLGSGDGWAKQLSSAGIARPIIGLAIRLFGPDGEVGDFLPDWHDVSFRDAHNASGEVGFSYARTGVNADKLIGRRVEGALFDGTLEVPKTRFLIKQTSTDTVQESADANLITVHAPAWVPARLSEATVYPPDFPNNQVSNTAFGGATPGHIIGTLLARARARGVGNDVVSLFSTNLTSDSQAWANVVTMEVEPGGSIFSVLEKLTEMGVCDWTFHGRELVLLNPDSGIDRTLGDDPLVLHVGRDILDAPEGRDLTPAMTAVLVTGKDGISVEVIDAAEEQRQGTRIEGFLSVSGVDDKNTLRAIGEKALLKAQLTQDSMAHGLALFSERSPTPWVDYKTGDWLYRDIGDGRELQKYRVAELSATYAADGTVTGNIILGTRFMRQAEKLQAQIDALTNSSGNDKSAPASGNNDDFVSPATPTGLILTSDVFHVDTGSAFGGQISATVNASWLPVVYNVDGSLCTDLDFYEIKWRVVSPDVTPEDQLGHDKVMAALEIRKRLNSGAPIFEDLTWRGCPQIVNEMNDILLDEYEADGWTNIPDFLLWVTEHYVKFPHLDWEYGGKVTNDTSRSFGAVPPNTLIEVSVRAVDRSANASYWCDPVRHTTTKDNTPPPRPTKPVVTSYLGQLRVSWDGRGL